MAFKIIAGICLVATTTLVGLKMAGTYKYRKDFFDALVAFNVRLSSDVSFFKHTLGESLKNPPEILSDTFLEASTAFSTLNSYRCQNKQLDKEQRALVSEYLSSIGLSDENAQLEMLKVYDERLKTMQKNSEITNQKYAKLFPKLGFLTGVSAIIVLI